MNASPDSAGSSSEGRRYELLGVLGSGGFGTVYRARFLGEGGFSKEVALKVLNPSLDDVAELAGRLRDEARVLGLLRHRAIVAVDRLTLLDGRWAVVMEYVDGVDLTAVVKRGPVPVCPALEIAAEVASALHAAYTRPGPDGQPLQLRHRDLKPSNVRLTPDGDVKVLDFGIARAEFGGREAKTRSLAFGSPEYMSPARLDFSDDGAAGDVYALGAVLFELLTARPLGRTSANPFKHQAKLAEATEALARVDGLPEAAARILLGALAFEARDRPGAGEVEREATELARRLGGEPLRAWAGGVVAALSQEPAEAANTSGSLTGSTLVERPVPTTGREREAWRARAEVPPPPVVPRPAPVVARSEPAEGGPEPVERPPGASRPAIASAIVAFLLVVAVGALVILRLAPLEEGEPGVDLGNTTSSSGINSASEPPPDSTTSGSSEPPNAGGTPDAAEADAAVVDPVPSDPSARAPPTKPPSTDRAGSTRSSSRPAFVRVAGDAAKVTLVGDSTRYTLPAQVPAGPYWIYASFQGETESYMGPLTLEAGKMANVRCEASARRCWRDR